MNKKTAFVLSGGGASGAWQVGALKAFLKEGITPDFITANSAGSLNAVGLSYAGMEELEAMWHSIRDRKDLFLKKWPFSVALLFGHSSFMSSKPLRQKIHKMMDGRTPKYPVCVNSVSLKTGMLRHTWSDAPDFQTHVLASASIPVIVEPVEKEWVDGGIRENSPLRIAIDKGAERIFLFLNSPKERIQTIQTLDKVDGIKEIGARVLEILMDEAFYEDIAIREVSDAQGVGKKVEVIFVQPDKDYLQTMDFNQGKISLAISKGYLEASRLIAGIKKNDLAG